jgi:hypothetical protein
MEEGRAGSNTDRKISRRSEKPEINRVRTWTFQRFSAVLESRGGSSASGSAVQSQMPAEDARTRDDQIPGDGKLRADPVLAAQPRDERADKEQRCSVHAERMNRTDPAFGA